MFEEIKGKIKNCQRVSGLSKGMDVVDKYMRPGMNPSALDFSAGYAQARIHVLYENGEITENEMLAALTTLDNQHRKLSIDALKEIYA